MPDCCKCFGYRYNPSFKSSARMLSIVGYLFPFKLRTAQQHCNSSSSLSRLFMFVLYYAGIGVGNVIVIIQLGLVFRLTSKYRTAVLACVTF